MHRSARPFNDVVKMPSEVLEASLQVGTFVESIKVDVEAGWLGLTALLAIYSCVIIDQVFRTTGIARTQISRDSRLFSMERRIHVEAYNPNIHGV